MHHLRAHAGIAGALQDAAGAAADRIGQRRIAERELVIAVGVVLVLARIAAGLRKLPVDTGAARPADLGADCSVPTGTAPAVCFSGDASSFTTNKGTGDAFTTTGTITDATSSPSN
jgi:hypothetical protein